MSDVDMVPECFVTDSLTPKDVSHPDLCLVKKELQVHVKQGRKVQNTVILEGANIRVMVGF